MPDFDRLKELKSKNKLEQEKKLRCFSFAKLYFLNKDYQSALRNANEYLTVKEQSAPCHKLLGEIYEVLDDYEKAFEAYKKSYILDKSQEDVLIKICRLLEDLDKDPEVIKNWLNKVEKIYSCHSVVVNLREKLSILNVSYKSQSNFKDISTSKISDLMDSQIFNNKSFSNSQNTTICSTQIKSLERSLDQINKRIGGIEENISNTFNKVNDVIEENKKIFICIKEEIEKISSSLNYLKIDQNEIKTSLNDFINRDDDEDEDDNDEDEDEDEDYVYPVKENIINLNHLSNNNPEVKINNINSKLEIKSKNNVEFQNSQTSNLLINNKTKVQDPLKKLEEIWKCKNCFTNNKKENNYCIFCNAKKYLDDNQSSLEKLTNTVEKTVTEISKINLDKTNKEIPLSELFKDQNKNTWECTTCYVKNNLSVNKCISCEEPKKFLLDVKENQKSKTNDTFSFGIETSNNKISPGKFVFDAQSQKNTITKNESFNSTFTFGQTNSNFINQPFTITPGFIFGPQTSVLNTNLVTQATVLPNTNDSFSLTNNSAKNFFSPPKTITQNIFNLKQNELFSLSKQESNLSKENEKNDSKFSFNLKKNFTFTFNSNAITNNSTFPKTTTITNKQETSDENHNDDHFNEEAQVDFVPVIPLPPKIDVVTGEENEKIIFSKRAKLYRYVLNEWKERGLGEVKILHNVAENKYRFLMRRDQILKVCLNHSITTEFSFQKKTKPDSNTLVWAATDYSENEPQPSLFTIKFKTSEISKKFEDEVNRIVSILSKNNKNEKQDFVDSDDIQILYVKQPKSKEEASKALMLKLPINFFSYEDIPPCKGCFGCTDTIPKLNYELEKSDKIVEVIIPDNSNNSNLFAVLAQKENSTGWTVSTEKPSWLNTSNPAPIFSKSLRSVEDPEAEDNLQFKPVVPLPDLIDVTTGEEEEEILFSSRSKLFKFLTNEWKERGIGEFKILKHKQAKKIRFLMRRDQVHKVCLNHYVDSTLNISFRKGTENILQWLATDFSDGEGDPSLFNLRLKNKEIASSFLEILRKNIPDLKC